MACETPKETLIDLLFGELPEEEAIGLEQHLAECAACRAEMNALSVLTKSFVSEAAWQPDASMADRILSQAASRGMTVGVSAAPSGGSSGPALPPRTGQPGPWRVWWKAPFRGLSRPIPSYAAAGVGVLALVVGLVWGAGGHLFSPGEGSQEPAKGFAAPSGWVVDPASSAPTANGPQQLDSRRTRAADTRRRTSADPTASRRPIVFVAVQTDATRLLLPGLNDSL